MGVGRYVNDIFGGSSKSVKRSSSDWYRRSVTSTPIVRIHTSDNLGFLSNTNRFSSSRKLPKMTKGSESIVFFRNHNVGRPDYDASLPTKKPATKLKRAGQAAKHGTTAAGAGVTAYVAITMGSRIKQILEPLGDAVETVIEKVVGDPNGDGTTDFDDVLELLGRPIGGVLGAGGSMLETIREVGGGAFGMGSEMLSGIVSFAQYALPVAGGVVVVYTGYRVYKMVN